MIGIMGYTYQIGFATVTNLTRLAAGPGRDKAFFYNPGPSHRPVKNPGPVPYHSKHNPGPPHPYFRLPGPVPSHDRDGPGTGWDVPGYRYPQSVLLAGPEPTNRIGSLHCSVTLTS